MAKFSDHSIAGGLRDVIERIASSVISRERPDYFTAKVYSKNDSAQTCQVLVPGETIENLLTVGYALDKSPSVVMETTFAAQSYNAPGDIVRVWGRPGAFFILDYVSGGPANQYPDPYSEDTGWLTIGSGVGGAPPFLNGWTNWGGGWQTCRIRKRLGLVFMEGLANGSAKTSVNVFQLPVGWRPEGSLTQVATGGGSAFSWFDIMADGTVNAAGTTTSYFNLTIPPFHYV